MATGSSSPDRYRVITDGESVLGRLDSLAGLHGDHSTIGVNIGLRRRFLANTLKLSYDYGYFEDI